MWEKLRVDGKKKLKHNAIPTIFENKIKNKNITNALHDNEMDFDLSDVSSISY